MTKRDALIVGVGVALAFAAALPARAADKDKPADADNGEYIMENGRWVKAAPPVPPAPPAENTAAGDLARIRQYVKAGHNRTAIKAADKFLTQYPDNAGREEAMFLAAQAYMNRGRYYSAYERLERQLAEFPGGDLSERAVKEEYKIGDAFLNGRKRIVLGFLRLPAGDEGVEILTRINEHVPGTVLSEKAMLRIGEYYFNRKDFTEAVSAYDNFIKLFPKSTKVPFAMLQAARAMYASFEGPAFDETPLIDAKERFEAFAETYPRQAEKAGVANTLRVIRSLRAQKLYDAAGLYMRKGRADAAEYYYKLVVEKYPRTDWAVKASAALAKMKPTPKPAPKKKADT